MSLILWFLGMTLIGSVVWGCLGCRVTEIYLEFKRMSHPYYNVGIAFNRYDGEEIYNEELIIGLFFVNIVAVFHKEK